MKTMWFPGLAKNRTSLAEGLSMNTLVRFAVVREQTCPEALIANVTVFS